ncbi:bestrophin family protein [Natronospira bacteriovora]|uniref:Bestrophin family ion channel n=1 Tax=Natronospira bacteriovora TaxID=3069753 RepID=A0ABU0W5Q2_9GAMM|nr:bestrophin family ion channel [Natronospira sp. AB-CW4]MDQ2068355.1 bestrophin family ion channel [Natronospira sp. AB-CW4]
MIVTRRISLTRLLGFTWPKLLILAVFTLAACLVMDYLARGLLQALSYAAGFLGTALAFLIGFRNNAAYGRWWEGHQIWSRLKYNSRSFAMLVQGLIQDGEGVDSIRRQLVHRQAAFAWWLNHFLRKRQPGAEMEGLLDPAERQAVAASQHPPLALLVRQGRTLRELAESGRLDAYRHVRFTELLQAFNEVLGSSERLKKTPFPMQYTWFMSYTLVLFLLVLPLSLAGHLGYWSVPFALLIGYAYIMLEYVGRYIENPFENQVNDVPLDYIARTIEIDLREMLGETDLPEPIQPRGLGYLY